MTHLAATATHHPLALAILAALVWAGYYLAACTVWPFTHCRRCHGLGRFHGPGHEVWRPCRRCRGTGARLRTGRRLLNHLTRLYRNSR